jgi:hypothetical protein
MNKIWLIIEALYAGKSLKDRENWKRFGVLTNVFGVIIASLIGIFPDFYVSEVDQDAIVKGAATLAFVINSYLHVATTEKIGLGDKK